MEEGSEERSECSSLTFSLAYWEGRSRSRSLGEGQFGSLSYALGEQRDRYTEECQRDFASEDSEAPSIHSTEHAKVLFFGVLCSEP